MGKRWLKFWELFNSTMAELPNAIDEMVEEPFQNGCVAMSNRNGHVAINGRIYSLRINGYTIRIPEKVMKTTYSKR